MVRGGSFVLLIKPTGTVVTKRGASVVGGAGITAVAGGIRPAGVPTAIQPAVIAVSRAKKKTSGTGFGKQAGKRTALKAASARPRDATKDAGFSCVIPLA
jgi:hypothetical protein